MSAPKVSVIIPAFNAARYLEAAIQSVFAQTFSDFEVVVIDDGSTDETEQMVKRFGSKLGYRRQEHAGRAHARNTGLTWARGEYIAFLDADDVWKSDRLSRGVRLLDQRSDIGLVHGEVSVIDAEGNLKAEETNSLRKTYRFERNFGSGYLWLLADHSAIFSSTILFRRDLVSRVGFYDETFPIYEDYDWYLRFAFGHSFFLLDPPAVAQYRKHGANSFTEFTPEIVSQIYLAILEKQLTELQTLNAGQQNRIRTSRVLRKMAEFHWRLRDKGQVKAKLLEAAKLDPRLVLDVRSLARFVFSL